VDNTLGAAVFPWRHRHEKRRYLSDSHICITALVPRRPSAYRRVRPWTRLLIRPCSMRSRAQKLPGAAVRWSHTVGESASTSAGSRSKAHASSGCSPT